MERFSEMRHSSLLFLGCVQKAVWCISSIRKNNAYDVEEFPRIYYGKQKTISFTLKSYQSISVFIHVPATSAT